MKHLLYIGLTFILVACGQKSKNENSLETKDSMPQTTHRQDSVVTQKMDINSIHKSDFEKLLKDPETPKIAIDLYYNSNKMVADTILLDLLENLNSKDNLRRWFYFRVITNSYKISDSSYAEGLGNTGKEYIENKTCEFASYFGNKECFTERDLETWADIVFLELGIELSDNGYDKKIVLNYNKKIKQNCLNATVNQKETIDKFCKLLDKKYNEYKAQQ